MDDELELRARCPTHPLRELDQKLLNRRIRTRIAHDVEIVRLDGVKIALILEPRDRRTVCAALQLLARLRLEIPRTRPCHIVVIRNIRPCLDVLLLIHLCGRAVNDHIGCHVKCARVVNVCRYRHRDVIPSFARILCLRQCAGCRHRAVVEAVEVPRFEVEEEITQGLELRRGIRIAEDRKAALLKVLCRHGKHTANGAPVQLKRHRCIAAIRDVRRCPHTRHKIDIRPRQFLVLKQPSTAAQCHKITPS